MLSPKHIVLAFACIVSHHVGTSTASPTMLRARSESVLPTDLLAGVPSGSFPGLAKPTATFTAPPSAVTGVKDTTHCDDMPGNHTHMHDHHQSQAHDHGHDRHHLNQTGGPDRDFHHNCTDHLKPTGTKVPASLITPPPDSTAVANANAAKFRQTTYYSCVTIGPDSHCGWHEPIVDAGTSNSAPGLAVDNNAWLSLLCFLAVLTWM